MAPLVILEGEQLRQLARILRNQEAEAIKNIAFKSEHELEQYLRDIEANYHSVIKLLDDGDGIKQKFEGDETRSSIAHDIHSYLEKSANVGLQAVKNYSLRKSYLTKISDHSKRIIRDLEALNPKTESEVARLAGQASEFRNSTLNYIRELQSPVSQNFSILLKESGVKFDDLLKRYQKKHNLSGPFEELELDQKLLVYTEIIEASGRGRVIVNNITKVSGAVGLSLLIFMAGMMVWDIFSSEHILQTATHDDVVTVASVGGAVVGEVVGAALPSLVGIQASPLFVMGTGIIGSFLGAYVIGEFVGWLIDSIFSSGGSYPLNTNGHHCYVAPLPDGEAIAHQIAHH